MKFGAIDPSFCLSRLRMPWFKKSKKPLQPSQQHASLGIPAHIAAGPLGFGATLGVYPTGVLRSIFLATDETDLVAVAGINNGGGSRITLLDRKSVDEQVRPSSTSTRTPEHENDAASECASHCSC